jgi:hypothetical protein
MRLIHAGLVGALAAVGLLITAPASAQDAQACIDAHGRGQLARREGRLIEARASFIQCNAAPCPGLIRQDCGPWVGEVEALIPTVTIRARADGADVMDVLVTIDGKTVTDRLTGSALSLDPGPHTFRFAHGDLPPVERRVVLAEGEKARAIEVELGAPKKEVAAPAPTPAPVYVDETGPLHWSGYVFGGVAITGLAVFVGFGAKGLGDRSALEDECSPFCKDDDLAPAQTSFLVADIGVGAAVVGSVGLITAILLRPTVRRPISAGGVELRRVWAGPRLEGGRQDGADLGVGGAF